MDKAETCERCNVAALLLLGLLCAALRRCCTASPSHRVHPRTYAKPSSSTPHQWTTNLGESRASPHCSCKKRSTGAFADRDKCGQAAPYTICRKHPSASCSLPSMATYAKENMEIANTSTTPRCYCCNLMEMASLDPANNLPG